MKIDDSLIPWSVYRNQSSPGTRRSAGMGNDSNVPLAFKKSSSKPKKSSKLRLSLADEDDIDASGGSQQEVFKPKRKVVSGIRNDSMNRGKVTTSSSEGGRERKSVYSADYLASLRESTPTTPRDLSEHEDDGPTETTNDLQEEDYRPGTKISVPDEGTIRHLKGEREVRRRAGENYVPLSTALSSSHRDTTDGGKRIQTEDAVDDFGGDGTEGLRGFEDETLPLGTTNLKRAEMRKRSEMEGLIQERQDLGDYPEDLTGHTMGFGEQGMQGKGDDGGDDEDASSDSDDEWERTQLKKFGGDLGQRHRTGGDDDNDDDDTHTASGRATRAVAPEMRPIPTVEQSLKKLQARLEAAQREAADRRGLLAQIESELVEIAEQEEAIKTGLRAANLAHETALLKLGGLESVARVAGPS